MSPAHPTHLPLPLAYIRHPHPPIAPTIHEKRDTCCIFHGWHTPIPHLHSKTRNTPPWEPERRPIGAMFLMSLAPPSSPTPSPTCHSEQIPLGTAQNWWVTVKYCQGFTLADNSHHYFFILAIPSIFISVSNFPQFLLKLKPTHSYLPFAKLKYYLAPVRHCFSLRND